jgi:hypothetical protein
MHRPGGVKIEREIRRRGEGVEPEKRKFPRTRQAFERLLRALAKKYGQPYYVVRNTVQQYGITHALKALEVTPPREPALSRLLKRLKGVRGAWSRRQ